MAAVLWIVALLLVVLTIVNPRELWYATTAWQFRNPEANEPSEASFALGRVVSGVAALGFGIAALVVTLDSVGPLSQERLDSAGSSAARDLTGSFYKYGTPDALDVEEAIDRDDVRVTEGPTTEEDAPIGEAYGVEEHYEIRGIEDASIVGCLVVSYDGGLFAEDDVDVDTTYSTGACS